MRLQNFRTGRTRAVEWDGCGGGQTVGFLKMSEVM